jgi:hypothetical protein
MTVHRLEQRPLHLGAGATAAVLPEFTGDMAWYDAYGQQHGGDDADGRLVSMHTFTAPWDTWEMHPVGHEVVVCVAGCMTLHQEAPDGSIAQATLQAGEYAINAPGVWHTADIEGTATALFITAGAGTQLRER